MTEKTERPRWLSTGQMAELVRLHQKTLQGYARDGRVPEAYLRRPGRRYRWRSDWAEDQRLLEVPRVPGDAGRSEP